MAVQNSNFNTLIAAIDTKAQSLAASATDPKDLVYLSKSLEALNVTATVSDIIAAGDTKVTAVNTAGSTQVGVVQAEGTTQVAAVTAAGGSYATTATLNTFRNIILVTVTGGKLAMDGTSQQALKLTPSVKYRFDQSDASNATHSIKFSTTSDGTHGSGTAITAGVTEVGTAGSAGAYVEITLEQDAVATYYYCANHAGMGGTAYSISSGGGSSSTLTKIAETKFQPNSGYAWQTTYASALIRAGGVRGHTFGSVHMATAAAYTAAHGRAVTVNPSTGALTETAGNSTYLWANASGAAASTTYFNHPYGTGAVFYGGHNAWPGYGSHYMGYGTAYLTAAGAWTQGVTSGSNADHGYNGFFQSIPAINGYAGNSYFINTGYNTGTSLANYRVSSFSGGSFSIGGLNNPNPNTSTSYGVSISPNGSNSSLAADAPVSGIIYQMSSTDRRVRMLAANGSQHASTLAEGFDATYNGVMLTSGKVALYSHAMESRLYTNYSTFTVISSPNYLYENAQMTRLVHVKDNKFIRGVSGNHFGSGIQYVDIDPSTGVMTDAGWMNLPDQMWQYDSSHCDLAVVHDYNTTSGSPVSILIHKRDTNSVRFATMEWPSTFAY